MMYTHTPAQALPCILPAPAPSSWAKSQRDQFLACAVCTHGIDAEGRSTRGHTSRAATHCACQAVAGQQRVVPVTLARSNHGACGPEARHQAFPGLA